jgi:hypothetical protein
MAIRPYGTFRVVKKNWSDQWKGAKHLAFSFLCLCVLVAITKRIFFKFTS